MSSKNKESSLALLCLFLCFSIALQFNHQPAQAIRLPSFLSWIQPQQHQQQVDGSESMLASASSSFADQNVLKQQQQQQQQVSPLRKPFQSISLIGKHNHLFSALPKSLFGRFLSSGSAATPIQASPPLGWPAAGLAYQMAQIAAEEQMQLQRDQQHRFSSNRAQFVGRQFGSSAFKPAVGPQPAIAQKQQSAPVTESNNNKKHALGLGENDDFLLIEQPVEQNEHPYGQAKQMQSEQQFQEVPAVLISSQQEETSAVRHVIEQSELMSNTSDLPIKAQLVENATILIEPTTLTPSLENPLNESSVLSSLISAELQKLKEDPELNKTSINSSKLAELFLEPQRQVEEEAQKSMEQSRSVFGERQQTSTLAPSLESGGLESSAQAVVVEPQQGVDESMDSFIIGPYKGLTGSSDQVRDESGGGQFREAADLLANFQMQQQRSNWNNNQQVVGMNTGMASNLIQQAKNLIQMPFVHLANNQQQQQQQRSNSQMFGGQLMREPLMDQQSAPSSSFNLQPIASNYGFNQQQHHFQRQQWANNGAKRPQFNAPFKQQSNRYFLRPQAQRFREKPSNMAYFVEQKQRPYEQFNFQFNPNLYSPQKVRKSHPLNELNEPTRQSDFHLVVNHGQLNFKPSAYFSEQNSMQQQSVESAKNNKFKSGFYQIEPPKLVSSETNQTIIEQPIIEQEPELEEQVSEKATEQQSADSEEVDEQQEEPIADDQQVSSNGTRKGFVFNEPLALKEKESGKNLSQVKELKFSQDVTLYDIERPNDNQLTSASAQESAHQQPATPTSPINFLDTQVYTVPYTMSVQPSGRTTLSAGYPNERFPPRNPQQQHMQPAYNQMARFPLPYLAPPGPRPQEAWPAQQAHFTGSPDYGASAPPVFRSIYQDFTSGLQQIEPPTAWRPQHSVPQSVEESELRFEPVPSKQLSSKQHYFHYLPLSTPTSVPSTTPIPQPSEEPPNGGQQFMLAIKHQGDSAAPDGAALFASNFLAPASFQQQLQQNQQVVSERTPEVSQSSNDLNQLEPTREPESSSPLSTPVNPEEEQSSSPEANRELQVSSPSTFCADRAPGLYADESQRCKAYYQCAPTGHQMFRCNNQTQFNQKTQNCDWWYNVNCGGRLGSPADFEQATDSPNSEQTTQQPIRQQDSSLTEASSSEQPQEMQLLMKAAPEEQDKSDKSPDWSSTNQEQQAELFHHSDSLANITVAPEVASPQPQQAAPRASTTPTLYGVPTTGAGDGFAERSTTTQDPLLRESSSSTEASELARSSSAAPAVIQDNGSSTSTSTISLADSTSSQQTVVASTEPAEATSVTSGSAEQETSTATRADQADARRLVQSEFGLGVKQGSKSARSTSGRFQFVRAQPDQLFSGALVELSPKETPLYSTSANQGSISYSPHDDQLRPANAGGVAARKPERRFGARLFGVNQQEDRKKATR